MKKATDKKNIRAQVHDHLVGDGDFPQVKYCECGCGQIVKKRFVSGHNGRVSHGMKGKSHSQEARNRMSEGHKGMPTWNKGLKGVQVGWNKGLHTKSGMEGKKHSEAAKKKMSEAKIGSIRSVKSRKKQALNNTTNPNYGMKGKSHSEETKLKLSKRVKKLWQDKEYVKHMSKVHKEKWQNEEFVKMMYKTCAKKPNKAENFILNLLNELYPNEWKYTGDFSVVINGKNPDFINVNGQKKIIEFFGDYWHQGEDPKDRAKVFAPFGYETLVVWESELKNMDSVVSRIKKFAEKRVI